MTKKMMNKFIVEINYTSEGMEDSLYGEQYAISTALSADEVHTRIGMKSKRVEAAYRRLSRGQANNVVYFDKSAAPAQVECEEVMSEETVKELCTLDFEQGKLLIPHGLVLDETYVFTLDEWFDYCLKE